MRFRHARLICLDARTPLDECATLLPCAAEKLARREQVEVRLRDFGRKEDRIDRTRAETDHERTRVLLLHLVDEIAVFRAVRIRAASGRFQIIAHALEIVEVFQTPLTAFGAVFQHAVARTERNLAANHLVLRVIIAADDDVVNHDRHAFGHLKDDVNNRRIALAGNALHLDARISQARIARTDRHLNAVRGIREFLLPGDRTRTRQGAPATHGFHGIARDAANFHRSKAVARAFDNLEYDVALLRVFAGNAFGKRDLHIQIAVIAVDFLQFCRALSLHLNRDGRIREPADRIPPGVVVDRLAELSLVETPFRRLPPGRIPPRAHRDVVRAVEDEVPELLPPTFVHDEGNRAVVPRPGDGFDERRDLRIEIVFLLVGKPHLRRRCREVAFAIEKAILQLGLLRHARFAEIVAPLDDQRGLEAEFALHEERHLHAVSQPSGIRLNFRKFPRILQRSDVTGYRDGIVDRTDLCLTPGDD